MTKPYSEATAEMIDQEVSKLVQHAYSRVLDLLRTHQVELEILAKELLEKEILFQADLERLIGKRPFEKETTYQAFTNKKEPVLAEPTPEVAEGTEKEEAAEALPPTPDAATEEPKTDA
jgi:cell division protease FtsH